MTTKPTPQDEAEALAIKAIVDESGILTRLNAMDIPSFAKAMVKAYRAGQSSLLERLAKEGSEFEENEALEWIKSKTVSDRMDIKFAVDVARWQHEKLSPLIAYWKNEAEELNKRLADALKVRNERSKEYHLLKSDLAVKRELIARLEEELVSQKKHYERMFDEGRALRAENAASKIRVGSQANENT